MSNLEMAGQPESIRYGKRIKRILLLFTVVAFGVLGLSGCGQTDSVPTEDTPQEVQAHTELPAEPISDPESVPEPEVVSLSQPQADGTGVSFEIPEDWNQYPTDAMQRLQAIVDDAGNRVLYGVLHGFMESQEVSSISLIDYTAEDYEFMVGYELSYDVSLDDGSLLRLSMGVTGWCAEETNEISFDNIGYADVYPQFANYYWSMDCEDMEGVNDWVYQIVEGNTTQYYSISADFMADDYSDYGGYDDPSGSESSIPEEPTQLTQYNWPDAYAALRDHHDRWN